MNNFEMFEERLLSESISDEYEEVGIKMRKWKWLDGDDLLNAINIILTITYRSCESFNTGKNRNYAIWKADHINVEAVDKSGEINDRFSINAHDSIPAFIDFLNKNEIDLMKLDFDQFLFIKMEFFDMGSF